MHNKNYISVGIDVGSAFSFMTNSLMHGHIEILLNKKGEIEFVFRDKYNKRNEVISIILEDLEEFLSQQCLYSGIPKKTLIFRVQQR